MNKIIIIFLILIFCFRQIIVLNANDYFTIYGETKLHVSSETNFSACLLQAY